MNKLSRTFGWIVALLIPWTAARSGPVWVDVSSGLNGTVPGVGQLVIDHVTGNTLYALTSSGSIFKSTDGGSSWTTLGNIVGVNFLALDPTSPSIVYAGTAIGVFKSTDGGESWASAGLAGTPIGVLAIDPTTPSTLYAGNSHLYKSKDRGGSWTDLNLGLPGDAVAALVLDPSTPSTLYVALGQGAGGNLIKSVDGGATWSVIYANAGPFYGTLSNLVIDPSNPSTLYRINPLLKSTDGGASWTAIAFPVHAYLVAALAVDSRNSNTLYVSSIGSTGHAIYKSTDGGQSWKVLDTIIPATGSLVFSPDSSTIYAATGSGVFRSTDGGLNWGEAQTGLRVHDIRMLVGDPFNPAVLYAGDNNGVFQSLDGGANWAERAIFQVLAPSGSTPFPPVIPAELHSLLIDFTNPNILYLGTGRPGGCYAGDVNQHKSIDGGSSWSDVRMYPNDGCDTRWMMAMDPTDPNTLYLPLGDDWNGFSVVRTMDGGAHWTYLGGSGSWDEVNAVLIDPNSTATLYAATDYGVFRSVDSGKSFLPDGLANTEVALLAIDPDHSNVLYAAASNIYNSPQGFLGMYKSTDSGASWSPINQGLGQLIAVHAAVNSLLVDSDYANILYLATSGFGVFRSSDAGATWAPFNEGLTNLDVRSLALVRPDKGAHRGGRPGISSPSILYAGTPSGVSKISVRGTPTLEK
jgi:photosystem II stability/assembly factor-like uncharacterized protein